MNQNSLNFEVLDLGLVLYKDIIPEPNKIIDKINSVDKRLSNNEHGNLDTISKPWKPWSYGDMTFCEQKFFPQAKDIQDSDYYANDLKEISNALYSTLDEALEHYSNVLYPFAAKNIKGREYNINLLRYSPGGHLPAHQDQGVSTRVLSSVSYLNDDYEGGEIEFVNSNVRIKPPAGSIIFFPSNFLYVHEVHPIHYGQRYSLPHWFHNRKDFISSTGEE